MLKKKVDPYRDYAKTADLVYFGEVHEEHGIIPIKGVTFTPKRRDTYFMQGPVQQREVAITYRETQSEPKLNITIVQCRLVLQGLPHVIFDGPRQDEVFLHAMMAKFPHLRDATPVLAQVFPTLGQYFRAYCVPDRSGQVQQLFSAILPHLPSFQEYDIELDNNHLYLYSRGKITTSRALSEMVSAAIWLATAIDEQAV